MTTNKRSAEDWQKFFAKIATETTEQPRLFGNGSPEFSTNLGLDISPRLVWDTNRWYQSLGVNSDASRKQLAAGYWASNGQQSSRLTHIIKKLLDPVSRHAYDATPIGFFFADDPIFDELRLADDSEVILASSFDHHPIYLWGIESPDESDHLLAATWMSAVACQWWGSGEVTRMAVGICATHIDPQVVRIGQRMVAFLPRGVAPKDAREYAARIWNLR